MILSTRGPQKETLEETKIYSIVIGPSVSQVAGASPFCRAVKVFLVQGWNKLGLLGILLSAPSASFPGTNMLAVVQAVTWQRTVTLPSLGAESSSLAFCFVISSNKWRIRRITTFTTFHWQITMLNFTCKQLLCRLLCSKYGSLSHNQQH